jgi:phosphate transport system substrate-binding protein
MNNCRIFLLRSIVLLAASSALGLPRVAADPEALEALRYDAGNGSPQGFRADAGSGSLQGFRADAGSGSLQGFRADAGNGSLQGFRVDAGSGSLQGFRADLRPKRFEALRYGAGATNLAVDPALPPYEPQPYSHPAGAGYLLPDGSIRIVGAQGMDVAFKNLNALFVQAHPEAKFQLDLKSAATAIGGMYTGVSAFGPNVRGFWVAEISAFRMTFGYEPTPIKVAHGAFSTISKANPIAIFVNQRNPIDRLTTEQVARIFSTGGGNGDLAYWGQVGAAGEWARHRIHPIGPSNSSGNVQGVAIFMKQSHFGDFPFAAGYEEALSTAAVVKRVKAETSAIGFASFDGLQGQAGAGLKVLAIGDRAGGYFSRASQADVLARKYPYTRDIYIYVNRAPGQPLNSFVREYLRLVLSQPGQRAFSSAEAGFLPLDGSEVAAERAKLD